ncbi:hypothetical protein [Halorubellus sp. PRR65]|uniref:hypothetical protein n=1 Tax=Halorubellus sp. PRR65 TaxID=3098148 RepID=UPI002B261262|nr:hypothetical protein [Halorubellus sp. PRR65]
MADTKRGREKKGLRDARKAELRVLKADVDALRDDETVEFYDEADVDEEDVLPYIIDDARDATTVATDSTGTFDLPRDD